MQNLNLQAEVKINLLVTFIQQFFTQKKLSLISTRNITYKSRKTSTALFEVLTNLPQYLSKKKNPQKIKKEKEIERSKAHTIK